MNNDLLYQVALTLVPHIGDVQAKALTGIFGDAQSIFKAKKKDLEKLEGIGTVRASSIKNFSDFTSAETEIVFMERYRITPLFITDPAYPKRLLHCYDSPALLYYRGEADLNHPRILSVVGTRKNTVYGKACCEKMIEGLKDAGIMIISGLAFGIDTIAHTCALQQQLPTVAVLAHGLDRIYPPQNKQLARNMIANGGLLTDQLSFTLPDKQNFPKRNRIVAGLCDALLVVESGCKGGSLITAEMANSYNRDVFAIPGRSGDLKSEGCNRLIHDNKASLVTTSADILEAMNWQETRPSPVKKQKELFIELSEPEQRVVTVLQQKEQVQVDELCLKTGLSSGTAANALLMLEMQGIVAVLPGKFYKLV